MSRQVFLLGAAIAFVALAFLLTDRLVYRVGLTEANVKLLRPGMSAAHVTHRLGELHLQVFKDASGEQPAALFWDSERIKVWVELDRQGHVKRIESWSGQAWQANTGPSQGSTLSDGFRSVLGR